MNNEPVAWMRPSEEGYDSAFRDHSTVKFCTGNDWDGWIPLYTHPVKDREKDRLRFSDEAFNRWLDEGISDSGHTVYDLVENVCEAWRGWENSQYYTHPVKEQDESFDRTASHMAGEYVSWTSCVACGQRVTGDSIHTCSPQLKQLTDEETESFEFWSPATGWDSIPIPANKKLSGRDLQRWRQEAWRRLDDDYKQDPEGAFVMGFDAGIAILRKASEK